MAKDKKKKKSAEWELIEKLDKELKSAALLLDKKELRFLVDLYYQFQDPRKATGMQYQLRDDDERDLYKLLDWFHGQFFKLERNVHKALSLFVDQYRFSDWAQSIVGIGPVITAGLMGHLSVPPPKYVGQWWSFAGLPSKKPWKKGEKRPHNAQLKQLVAFHVGGCIIRTSNHKDSFYGKLYKRRKIWEVERNEAGHHAERAAELAKVFRKDTKAKEHYEQGVFPPGHVDAMARRWVAKMFISDVHHVWWLDCHGEAPPEPFAQTVEGHQGGYRPPPNLDVFHSSKKKSLRKLVERKVEGKKKKGA